MLPVSCGCFMATSSAWRICSRMGGAKLSIGGFGRAGIPPACRDRANDSASKPAAASRGLFRVIRVRQVEVLHIETTHTIAQVLAPKSGTSHRGDTEGTEISQSQRACGPQPEGARRRRARIGFVAAPRRCPTSTSSRRLASARPALAPKCEFISARALSRFLAASLLFAFLASLSPLPASQKKNSKGPQDERQDYLKKWLKEDVVYIITDDEKAVFETLSEPEEKEKFIEQLWTRRDPDPRSPENEFKEEHYRRIAYANEHFTSGDPGWMTDRGRIYIIHGKPDSIESRPDGGAYNRPIEEGGGTKIGRAHV